jgi:phosphonate metabolism protein (transferase hexapeptide repeat family)
MKSYPANLDSYSDGRNYVVLPAPFHLNPHSTGESMLSKTEPLFGQQVEIKDCSFGSYNEVGDRTQIAETVMGDYSYVVKDSEIIYTEIGKFCSIAAHVRINPGNHPMQRVSQSHFTYRSSWYFEGVENDIDFFEWRRSQPVTIGHDVWIGHGVVVLPGVTIGTGAVIAAGAVVSKDVPNYTIVAGIPAKPMRRRFSEQAEAALLEIAWWDWDHETLRDRLPDFRHLEIDEFISKYR